MSHLDRPLLVARYWLRCCAVHQDLSRVPDPLNATCPHPTDCCYSCTSFHRVHIDTMHMPRVAGLSYILQGHCSLISYLEFQMLAKETGAAVGKFVFEDLLCRWGVIEEIVMDNGAPIMAGLKWLAKKYHITHIHISPYNKQANSIVERSHRSIGESIVKACDGDITCWPSVRYLQFTDFSQITKRTWTRCIINGIL